MIIAGPITSIDSQVGLGNTINSDKFLEFSRSMEIPYLKRDFLFRSGAWRGIHQKSLYQLPKESAFLLIGHSDQATTAFDQRIARMFGKRYMMGSNLLEVEGFSAVLPLGLTNPTNESDLHQIFGEVNHFERAWDSPAESKCLNLTALVGFSERTNPVRKKLLRLLLDEKISFSVTYHEMAFSNNARIDFLAKSRSHDMVLCPEGNGFDTHRFWETLYMGGVPVVKQNPYLNPLFELYPCIVLETWVDLLDMSLIERLLQNARAKLWDSSTLKFEFWKSRIGAKYIEHMSKS